MSVTQPGIGYTVGVGSTTIVKRNPGRSWCLIVNDSDTDMYLRFGDDAAALNSGLRLNVNGGSVLFGPDTDMSYIGSVQCISAVATKNATIVEVNRDDGHETVALLDFLQRILAALTGVR